MEWISVDDKLPENRQEVIIIRRDPKTGNYYVPDTSIFSGGEFCATPSHDEDSLRNFNPDWITHWMPLPEPPKS